MKDKVFEILVYAHLFVVYGIVEPTKDFVRMCWNSFVEGFVEGVKAVFKIRW